MGGQECEYDNISDIAQVDGADTTMHTETLSNISEPEYPNDILLDNTPQEEDDTETQGIQVKSSKTYAQNDT